MKVPFRGINLGQLAWSGIIGWLYISLIFVVYRGHKYYYDGVLFVKYAYRQRKWDSQRQQNGTPGQLSCQAGMGHILVSCAYK
jgi:hypothetical protein